MYNSDLAGAIAFNELHCSMDSPENREITQYKFYLAQEAGVPLGYGFKWYIYGPYSEDLISSAYKFAVEEIPEHNGKPLRFKPEAQQKINSVNALYGEDQKNLAKSSWYRLLAVVAYYCRSGIEVNHNLKKDKKLMVEALVKKGFDKERIEQAFQAVINCIYDGKEDNVFSSQEQQEQISPER